MLDFKKMCFEIVHGYINNLIQTCLMKKHLNNTHNSSIGQGRASDVTY